MPLHVDRQGRVAVLTLDDPERRNALTAALVDEIVAAVDAAESDDGVGALVITGEPPAFCSGADVGNLAAMSDRGAAGSSDDPALPRVYEGFLRVLRCSVPTVAAVNGPAVGAGFNLALACDVRIAGESARFDTRFVRLGIHPGGGHTWLLERAVGPQAAAAMVLFGERVDGARAAELGLAWRCVEDDQLLDDAVALAERAAEAPRDLAVKVKATLRQAPWQPDFDAAVQLELERQLWSFEQGFFRPPTDR
ncbi:MAG: enoyl-CoA hydratase [Actinobacteria bacterium]|nr:enoyl-CoA hydratase [Actinomycetota bacterium]